jgi:hypothetical protein
MAVKKSGIAGKEQSLDRPFFMNAITSDLANASPLDYLAYSQIIIRVSKVIRRERGGLLKKAVKI